MIRWAASRAASLARVVARLGEAALDRLDRAAGVPRALREAGAATVEFVIVIPLFLLLFISTFESSIMMFRQVMLERGVDVASRTVRLDGSAIMGANQLKLDICNAARILARCEEHLVVELDIVHDGTEFTIPDSAQPCYSRATSTTTQDVTFIDDNIESQIMSLRACYAADPFFPTAGIGTQIVADTDGDSIRIVASTAFLVEPP